jgi:hypothetical protein
MQRVQGYSRILSTGAPAPSCTVTVYETGGAVVATIYADDLASPTPKANPFTADANGYWFFYAAGGKRYDVQLSGGGIATPYTMVADVPAGVGDGAVHSSVEASLPTAGDAAHAGRLARVTNGVGGLWVDTGAAWTPVLDYGVRSFAEGSLPAAGTAGRLRRVSDEHQGLYIDDGAAWNPVMAYGLEAHAKASLPTPAIAGRLRRATDTTRGVWMDTGAGGQWFPLSGDWVNVMEFGAVPGSSSDQSTAIQAAIDALATSGGTVMFPPGTYRVAVPVKVRDNVTLMGFGAAIAGTATGFVGDCVVQAYRRDDNTAGNEDKIGVIGLQLISPATGLTGAILDLTGCTNSFFAQVRLNSSTLLANAIRIADQNLTASSSKRCSNNVLLRVRADLASLGGTFLTVAQGAAGVVHNTLIGCQVINARVGVVVSGFTVNGPRLLMMNCAMDGDGHADSIAISAGAALPRHFITLGCSWNGFTDTTFAEGEVLLNTSIAVGASGTTAATALAPGGTSEIFAGSIYLKVAAGTVLAAGHNTYMYTLTSVTGGASFLVAVLSGMPVVPITFQVSLLATALTVTLVIGSERTLSADLVFRVVQIAP